MSYRTLVSLTCSVVLAIPAVGQEAAPAPIPLPIPLEVDEDKEVDALILLDNDIADKDSHPEKAEPKPTEPTAADTKKDKSSKPATEPAPLKIVDPKVAPASAVEPIPVEDATNQVAPPIELQPIPNEVNSASPPPITFQPATTDVPAVSATDQPFILQSPQPAINPAPQPMVRPMNQPARANPAQRNCNCNPGQPQTIRTTQPVYRQSSPQRYQQIPARQVAPNQPNRQPNGYRSQQVTYQQSLAAPQPNRAQFANQTQGTSRAQTKNRSSKAAGENPSQVTRRTVPQPGTTLNIVVPNTPQTARAQPTARTVPQQKRVVVSQPRMVVTNQGAYIVTRQTAVPATAYYQQRVMTQPVRVVVPQTPPTTYVPQYIPGRPLRNAIIRNNR